MTPIKPTQLFRQLDDELAAFDLLNCPIQTFLSWLGKAKTIEDNAEAMTLATNCASEGPAARLVLFKGLNDEGFAIYGNSLSQKGRNFAHDPRAALVFFWPKSGRQIRVSGRVSSMPRHEVEEYFASRALESQVASSISHQSQPIDSREVLEERFHTALKLAQEQGGQPCPVDWSGWRIKPDRFEFFIYREHRLNDRFDYRRVESDWRLTRLQP
jgi:pyridoxamine 5'-phosphate oxidase